MRMRYSVTTLLLAIAGFVVVIGVHTSSAQDISASPRPMVAKTDGDKVIGTLKWEIREEATG